MGKKSGKARKPTARGSSKVLTVLGVIVALSFVLSLCAPDARSNNRPQAAPTVVYVAPTAQG